ncbi:conserved hypothetical protein [delta proteobacterium NaphS2]|nr:conserved hypothetical protein [delta proteobacterium NaphS2]
MILQNVRPGLRERPIANSLTPLFFQSEHRVWSIKSYPFHCMLTSHLREAALPSRQSTPTTRILHPGVLYSLPMK